ncbi:MAG: hypothetical protein RSC93_07870 [Erysipelotrichaceae bacterium]|uniref:hypothetical protein n=1 Tax=Anaerorhabdus sp. TaxID=1872524 RepID=UPI002FC9C5CA
MVCFGKLTTNSILEHLSKNLVVKSIIYIDNGFCYDEIVKQNQCRLVQLNDHKNYNKVEHNSAMCSIHAVIKA